MQPSETAFLASYLFSYLLVSPLKKKRKWKKTPYLKTIYKQIIITIIPPPPSGKFGIITGRPAEKAPLSPTCSVYISLWERRSQCFVDKVLCLDTEIKCHKFGPLLQVVNILGCRLAQAKLITQPGLLPRQEVFLPLPFQMEVGLGAFKNLSMTLCSCRVLLICYPIIFPLEKVWKVLVGCENVFLLWQ